MADARATLRTDVIRAVERMYPLVLVAVMATACAKNGPAGAAGAAASSAAAASDPNDASIVHAVEPITTLRTAPDASIPTGSVWRAVRHETILADVAVPHGAKVEATRDAHGYPLVTVDIDGHAVSIQFDSGVGRLGATMSKKPPMVYSMATQRAHASPENLTALYVDSRGNTRVLGVIPGVKCSYEAFVPTPAATLERIYDMCKSMRSPELGALRASTPAERASGGMTSVPEGAWVETQRPTYPGAVLLDRPYSGRLFAGRYSVRGRACPASFESQRAFESPEVEARVEKRTRASGDAWIRLPTESDQGDRYPGTATVVVPREGRCCVVTFMPWLTQPSARQIDDAIALCDTYRIK